MNRPVLIAVEHPSTCMTCDEPVAFGAAAWWVRGVGVWHEGCEPPRSLSAYVREKGRTDG